MNEFGGENMFCRNCGEKLSDDSMFCSKCGARAEVENSAVPEEGNAKPMKGRKAGGSGKVIIVFIILIALAAGGFLIYSSMPSAKSAKEAKLANKYLQEGKYEDAVLTFQKAIEIEPKKPGYYMELAKAYLDKDKVEEAYDILDRGYKETGSKEVKDMFDGLKSKVPILVKRAEELILSNNSSDAITVCTKALTLDPDCGDAYVHRAFSYLILGDFKKARDDSDRAVKLNLDNKMAYAIRGYACNLGGLLNSNNMDDHKEGSLIDAKGPIDYLLRGTSKYRVCTLSNFKEGEQYQNYRNDFDKSRELAPDFAGAYGFIYRDIADLDRALELDPKFAMTYYFRALYHNAELYNKAKDMDKAIADYNKAIELSPEFMPAYFERGRVYFYDKQQYDMAIRDFSKAIELRPDAVIIYHQRGRAYKEDNQLDLAIADFKKAVSLNPQFTPAIDDLRELGVSGY